MSGGDTNFGGAGLGVQWHGQGADFGVGASAPWFSLGWMIGGSCICVISANCANLC